MKRIPGIVLLAANLLLEAQSTPGRVFDPNRDPQIDVAAARVSASKTNRNILLDVGGNWCPSCLLLDHMFHSEPLLASRLAAGYVVVHVNVSPENLNRDFLSHFPSASGYPFLIVLSPDGKRVIHYEDCSSFQIGSAEKGYDPKAIGQFLEKWRT